MRDVNIGRRLQRGVAAAGHDVAHVTDLFPDGTSDDEICDYADQEGAIVITRDRDYDDTWALELRPREVILLRSYKQDQKALLQRVLAILPAIETHLGRNPNFLFFELIPEGQWVFRIPPR